MPPTNHETKEREEIEEMGRKEMKFEKVGEIQKREGGKPEVVVVVVVLRLLLRVMMAEQRRRLKLKLKMVMVMRRRRVRADELLKLTDELSQHGQPFHAPHRLSLPLSLSLSPLCD